MNDAISIVLVTLSVSAVWAAYLAPWIRRCSVNTDELNIDLAELNIDLARAKRDLRELQLKLCISRLKFRLVTAELNRQRRDSDVIQAEIPSETETVELTVSDVGGDGDDKGI